MKGRLLKGIVLKGHFLKGHCLKGLFLERSLRVALAGHEAVHVLRTIPLVQDLDDLATINRLAILVFVRVFFRVCFKVFQGSGVKGAF